MRGCWSIIATALAITLAGSARAQVASPRAAPPTVHSSHAGWVQLARVGSGQIVGNKNSKIYHLPGAGGNLPSEKNRVYFNSEAEAQAAGYRPSKARTGGSSSTSGTIPRTRRRPSMGTAPGGTDSGGMSATGTTTRRRRTFGRDRAPGGGTTGTMPGGSMGSTTTGSGSDTGTTTTRRRRTIRRTPGADTGSTTSGGASDGGGQSQDGTIKPRRAFGRRSRTTTPSTTTAPGGPAPTTPR